MLGGKTSKRQLSLITSIEQDFPKNFHWNDFVNVLDQIIDKLDLNYLDLDQQYIEELVFFYGASRPDSSIKTNFIQFIKQSSLSQIIDIKTNDTLIISFHPNIELLYKDTILNPEWNRIYNELISQTKYLQNELANLKKKLESMTLDGVIIDEVPNFKEKVFKLSLDKSYLGLTEYLEDLEKKGIYSTQEIDSFFDDLEIISKKIITENKELQQLETDLRDIRKETNIFRRNKDIPKLIKKPRESLKIDKQRRHKINRLIQNTITGFLLKNESKYPNLKQLFLKSIKEIILRPNDERDGQVSQTGQGMTLSRLPFEYMSYQISPRVSAQQEISYPQNMGKVTDDPGYLRNSSNMVQFSGLEPFSLKPIEDERMEVDWWVNRLRDKTQGKYPNLKELKWIYQFFN